jgi:hypothetical protein
MPPAIRSPRVRTAAEAQSICERIWIDDQPGSINRGLLRAVVDGAPPHDRGEVARNGQQFRCNINWLTARAALNNARALYVDLINSVPNLITGGFSGDIDPGQASEWAMIICEKFTRMLRKWPQFPAKVDDLVDEFVGYGVGFGYHDNPRDWRWVSAGLGNVLFPRSTKTDEESVEICMMRRPYFPFELMDVIRDKQQATDRGWNVKEVVAAVAEKAQGNDPRIGNDYETLEKEMFEATFYYSYASKTEMVWTDQLYVREIDGTYTHMVVLVEKAGDFLYRRESEVKSVSEFLTIFPNGGGNGDIHGQRGLLFDIFPQTQAINQIQCEFVDNMRLSLSMMLQCESEEALLDLAVVDIGPFKVLPPKVQVITTNIMPPNADAVGALNYLTSQQAANTGQYSPMSTNNAMANAPTAYQARGATANDNTLSQSQANVFYAKWTHLMKRVYQRVSEDDWQASEPGGKEALEFQKECYEAGIPLPTDELNVLKSFGDIQAVQAIGYGSPANRMAINALLAQYAGAMSPEAQNEFYRNTVSSIAGNQAANLYFPRMTTMPNQGDDKKFAEMEDGMMRLGQPVSIFGNNLIHLTTHVGDMVQMMQEVLQGQMQPQPVITFLQLVIPHAQQHIELLAKDNINQGKAAEFAPILVEANALLQKMMSQQQRNQALAAKLGSQNQQAQQTVDPMEQGKTQAQIADIQSKIAERTQKMQLEAVRTKAEVDAKAAESQHKDATLAHKITLDSTKESPQHRPQNGT